MVDDNPSDATVARIYHGKSAVSQPFLHLDSGEALLTYLKSDNPIPAIVLLDINMPGMNGFETLEALRGDPEIDDVPVIVMVTSSRVESDIERALALGAADYFVKPTEGSGYIELFRTLSGA